MAVITKANNHEREADAFAWLSEAMKGEWESKWDSNKNVFTLQGVIKKRVVTYQASTLLEVIERAIQHEKAR